ncbi:hypothetical protein PRIPAC_79769, partial [Pristionchus pacificus]|uniref:G protein-coupled receptor n=1 Tax=Pristionchus pacificus TaxID=54126 RepID=A0A2A6CL27_PRIPA
SVCQMVLLVLAYTSFCFISYHVSSDWALFGTTTLAWALYHALDGRINECTHSNVADQKSYGGRSMMKFIMFLNSTNTVQLNQFSPLKRDWQSGKFARLPRETGGGSENGVFPMKNLTEELAMIDHDVIAPILALEEEEEKPYIPKIDHGIVAPLLALVTSIGLIANFLALYGVYRFKHLHNTFGVLCVVLALANFGDSSIHLVWGALGPYLFDKRTLHGKRGKIVGLYYSMEKNVVITALFVAMPITLALIQVSPLFWTDHCYMIYFKDCKVPGWGHADTKCNNMYSFYVDFLIPLVVFGGIVLLDGIAISSIRKAIKTIAKYDENFKFKLIMEIGFLVQSVCQKAFSIIGYASLSVISKYASNNDWVLFGTTTLAWPLIHAVDGIVMFIFQARRDFNRSPSSVFRVEKAVVEVMKLDSRELKDEKNAVEGEKMNHQDVPSKKRPN